MFRKVKIKDSIKDNEFSINGMFHQWGFDYEEFESGPGNYTVAIIEMMDGTVKRVIPELVKFIID